MHYPKDYLNQIICGNNLEIMPGIPDNSIDLIVTSPPYNNWRNRRTQEKKKEYWERTNIVYDSFSDKMTDEEYMDWQTRFLQECLRVLKPTGTICYNHKDRIFDFEVLSPLTWILKSGAVYRQRITWDRCGMQARNNVRFYRVEEDIYILGKEAKGFIWNPEYAKFLSIWKIPPDKKRSHPAPFPLEIPSRCIVSFTNPGDVVLDPFMGSGTTAVAARNHGRNYIGIDISETYCEQARKNMVVEQITLFGGEVD